MTILTEKKVSRCALLAKVSVFGPQMFPKNGLSEFNFMNLWAGFWLNFNFVDFWAYFGHFCLIKSAKNKFAIPLKTIFLGSNFFFLAFLFIDLVGSGVI